MLNCFYSSERADGEHMETMSLVQGAGKEADSASFTTGADPASVAHARQMTMRIKKAAQEVRKTATPYRSSKRSSLDLKEFQTEAAAQSEKKIKVRSSYLRHGLTCPLSCGGALFPSPLYTHALQSTLQAMEDVANALGARMDRMVQLQAIGMLIQTDPEKAKQFTSVLEQLSNPTRVVTSDTTAAQESDCREEEE